ncbi:MAG TPA: MMPL family transporter [Stackebrandtia sp.]|jgi:RND superfamily putative drug exporter|uniref:MMPL family transporter n=1 Tax=Stackebrandtia sp. TaxID=2023065 RepID=UPI002D593FBA|nr:MMPL family transporter [Stackebrandtia sp.]HZE37341.1 MMPL family transporter [Stackebrandtia sp.]
MSTPAAPRRALTVRVARWSATHPWKSIVVWLLFVVAAVTVGNIVGPAQVDDSVFWIGEAGHAESIAADGHVQRTAVEKFLITAKHGDLDAAAARRAAADLEDTMSPLREVKDVSGPRLSHDGSTMLVRVTMTTARTEGREHIQPIRDAAKHVKADHPDLRIDETGDASTSTEVDDALSHDLGRSEMITLPITLLILFLVFGSLIAAGIPILLALSSIFTSIGLYTLMSYLVPDAGGAVTSIILMMGMAFGVDYSLFYLKRVREERERSGGTVSPAASVEIAAATSGHAIVVSGIAVIVSLTGLYLASDVIFASIATGSILVVAVAMLSSLTVLPALLSTLGTRVDGRRGRRRAARPAPPTGGRVWSVLLRPATRRPLVTLLVAAIAMLALALPAFGMKLSVEGKETFPRDIPAVASYDHMVKLFPSEGPSHMVVAKVDAAHVKDLRSEVSALVKRARHDALFDIPATAAVRTSADGRTIAAELPTHYGSNTRQAEAGLRQLRTKLIPDTIGRVGGVEYAVTGEPAQSVDYSRHQAEHLPLVLGFVLLATFVMMVVAFRSVVIGLIGLGLNLLSAFAAWGALTLVFQGTWAENLLGFTSTGFIGSRTPLMIFAILFGLSVDYQIFVVSRIREAALRGVPTRQAVVDGIASSARVVTSAAIIMVSVFVSFMLIGRIEMKQLGFGLTLAVILDAVVVRIMILPAILTLLGRASWWPSRLDRRTPRAGAVAGQVGEPHRETVAHRLPFPVGFRHGR